MCVCGVNIIIAESLEPKQRLCDIKCLQTNLAQSAESLAESLNKNKLNTLFLDSQDTNEANLKDIEEAQSKQDAHICSPKERYTDNQTNKAQVLEKCAIHPESHRYDAIRDNLAKNAYRYLGVPYRWMGTSSNGFDCSGFVRAIYQLNGLVLPRISREQFNTGRSISRSRLQVGDLVFFTTNRSKVVNHVGIYIGNNQFIHAPRRGKRVSIANLEDKYWKRAYRGARDYL